MNRTLMAILAAVVLLPALPACSDACKELADVACQKAGEASEECKKIRTRAENASPDDRRSCTTALSLVSGFTPKN